MKAKKIPWPPGLADKPRETTSHHLPVMGSDPIC